VTGAGGTSAVADAARTLAVPGAERVLALGIALAILGSANVTRRDAPAGTHRCTFYPVTPVLYLLACLGVAASSCLYDPAGAISGMGLVLLGIPAFFVVRRYAGWPRGGVAA
jgi:hypothetical protein